MVPKKVPKKNELLDLKCSPFFKADRYQASRRNFNFRRVFHRTESEADRTKSQLDLLWS